ncbi:MAG: hypothetical protein AAF869_07210 [Pseudomonadota bacterium]
MIRKLGALALLASTFGVAHAGEVYDKCMSDVAGQEIAGAEEKCGCWESSLSGDDVAGYMALDAANWETEATASMKDTASSCGFE